jgi:hypothetical protein
LIGDARANVGVSVRDLDTFNGFNDDPVAFWRQDDEQSGTAIAGDAHIRSCR